MFSFDWTLKINISQGSGVTQKSAGREYRLSSLRKPPFSSILKETGLCFFKSIQNSERRSAWSLRSRVTGGCSHPTCSEKSNIIQSFYSGTSGSYMSQQHFFPFHSVSAQTSTHCWCLDSVTLKNGVLRAVSMGTTSTALRRLTGRRFMSRKTIPGNRI